MSSHQIYNEKELLLSVANGDEPAFRKLVKEHADFLLTYLTKLTKEREVAEEIVQDVFLKIWQVRDYLVHVENFRSYLFILSRNQALKAIDKALTLKKRKAEWLQHDFSEEDARDRERMMDLVDQAVAQLPSQQRKVWEMSRREGKTYAQVAADLGLSKETVKAYLKLANASIITYLRQHPELLLLALTVFRLS